MAFDFKKEFKEFYMPKDRPEIVEVPSTNYIAVRRGRSQCRGRCVPAGDQYPICRCVHVKNELQERL